MKQTSRIRVLSDRIPQALVFIYFCWGLSENMERRPTCHVYNEIITCRVIFLNLEESRSHENKRETGRARGQGPRPPLGRPPWPWGQSQPISRIMLHRPKGSTITVQSMSV